MQSVLEIIFIGIKQITKQLRKIINMKEYSLNGHELKTVKDSIKIVKIIDTIYSFIKENKDIDKFQLDMFQHDYKKIFQSMLPKYSIEYELVNDKNWLAYPIIKGNITDAEKEKIIEAMESDTLFLLHAEDKYYTKEKVINNNIMSTPKNTSHETECIVKGLFDLSNFKIRNLSSVELCFLKYITLKRNKCNWYVAGEWTYDYHINYKDVLNQFIGQNLVEIEEADLEEKMDYLLKIPDLKDKLRKKMLPLNGTKPILITRVIENSTQKELEEFNKERYISYKLTDKGQSVTELINPSLTKDMELEDKCYKLVLNGSINEAFKLVAKFQTQRSFPAGIGIDWYQRATVGLNKGELASDKMLLMLELDLPENVKSKQNNINACIVLGLMFGSSTYKIAHLINRLCNSDIDEETVNKQIEYAISHR